MLCEKPLVTTLSEINQILPQVERSGRVLYTVNNWKYAPIWKRVFEVICSGELGEIQSVSLNVHRMPNSGGGATNWRKCPDISGGGIMVDHGWHHLYILLAIMNDLPDSVSAKMNYVETGVSVIDETVQANMQFGDATAELYLTWQADCRKNFGAIKGDSGELLLKDDHIVLNICGREEHKTRFKEPLSGGSHHPEWMEVVIDDFYRCVVSGNFFNDNLREAVNCVRLIELSYESHTNDSKPIPVDLSLKSLTL